MATFSCPSKCEPYCKNKIDSSCKLSIYWKNILESEGPPFKKLSGAFRERVISFLKRMPESIQPKSLTAIVQASIQPPAMIGNPATTIQNYIVILPYANRSEVDFERVILHEIMHHMLTDDWLNIFHKYVKNFGWHKGIRNGKFVEIDGKDSADEDFVNNIEYYFFDKSKLSSLNPEIKVWIDKNLKNKLNLKEVCYEKN